MTLDVIGTPRPTPPPAETGDHDDLDGPFLWIHASRGPQFVRFSDLWTYRELLFYFAWRDVKVRYKQSILGILWILIQPIAQMVIFATIFGRIVGLPSEGVPYSSFTFAGLAVWTYFASTITKMATSLDGNIHLITKIYFPRFLLPVSVMLGTLVDFAIVLPIVVVLGIFAHGGLIENLLFLPIAVVILLAVTLGAGLWLSGLNARFRDVILALPIVLQLGFYLTPVVYSSSVVSSIVTSDFAAPFALVNPMLGVVELFRWAALGTDPPDMFAVEMSCVTACVLIATGGMFFARTERTIVDRV